MCSQKHHYTCGSAQASFALSVVVRHVDTAGGGQRLASETAEERESAMD